VRICLVYDLLVPYTIGGAERWYRDLAERLAVEGHAVTYLTLHHWPEGEVPEVPGVEVVSALPEWVELRVPCDLAAIPPLQKLIARLDADLPPEIGEAISYAFREMLSNAVEYGGHLDPAWLAVFLQFPERFMVGSDTFTGVSQIRGSIFNASDRPSPALTTRSATTATGRPSKSGSTGMGGFLSQCRR